MAGSRSAGSSDLPSSIAEDSVSKERGQDSPTPHLDVNPDQKYFRSEKRNQPSRLSVSFLRDPSSSAPPSTLAAPLLSPKSQLDSQYDPLLETKSYGSTSTGRSGVSSERPLVSPVSSPTAGDLSTVYISTDLSASDARFADRLLKRVARDTAPLSGCEYVLVVTGTLAGIGAAFPSYEFAKKFMENVLHIQGEGWIWGTAVVAFIPQALLSGKTNLEKMSTFIRSIPTLSCKDVKSTAVPLILGALSAFPSFKIALDLPHIQEGCLPWIVGGVRAFSAITFNSSFDLERKLMSSLMQQKYNSPIIKALMEAKAKLNSPQMNLDYLCRHFSDEKNPNALKHFLSSRESVQSIKKLFEIFTAIAGDHELKKPAGKPDPGIGSNTLGFLSAAMFWNTAIKVPSIFNLPHAKGIVDITEKALSGELDYLLALSFGIGGIAIGLPSWYLNTLANLTACNNLWNKISEIRAEGVREHFSKYTLKDWAMGAVTLFFSSGLGFCNGGMSYKYPMIEYEITRILGAVITGISFFGLGFMSIDGFTSALSDKSHQSLLLNAFEADNLNDYVKSLSEEDRKIFFTLLKKYLDAAIKALCAELINLPAGSDLVSKELVAKIIESDVLDDITKGYVLLRDEKDTESKSIFTASIVSDESPYPSDKKEVVSVISVPTFMQQLPKLLVERKEPDSLDSAGWVFPFSDPNPELGIHGKDSQERKVHTFSRMASVASSTKPLEGPKQVLTSELEGEDEFEVILKGEDELVDIETKKDEVSNSTPFILFPGSTPAKKSTTGAGIGSEVKPSEATPFVSDDDDFVVLKDKKKKNKSSTSSKGLFGKPTTLSDIPNPYARAVVSALTAKGTHRH